MKYEEKQTEWKNGDKCVVDAISCCFVGLSQIDKGKAIVECRIDGDTCSIRCDISKIQKPKEKRWLVYDAKGDFFNEYDYKPKLAIKSLQVIEIEINV